MPPNKRPWRDEETLRELYHDKGMSLAEVADELGCGSTTVGSAMEDLGIERRSAPSEKSGPWRDEGTLRELYYQQEMSLSEIGDSLGCDTKTVQRWMKKHDLERDTDPEYPRLDDEGWLRQKYKEEGLTAYEIAEEVGCWHTHVSTKIRESSIEPHSKGYGTQTNHPSFDIHRGYVRATSHTYDDGEQVSRNVLVHRLLAVSEFGFDEVAGMDVHHINGIPWDNRPDNIKIMDHGEHKRLHNLRQTEMWDRDPYEPQRKSD